MGHGERSKSVKFEGFAKSGENHIRHRPQRRAGDARVVDEYVERTGRGGEVAERLVVGDIEADIAPLP